MFVCTTSPCIEDLTSPKGESENQFFVIKFKSFLYARYVGRLFVKSLGKPIDILTRLNEMAGYAPDEDIELYEVC